MSRKMATVCERGEIGAWLPRRLVLETMELFKPQVPGLLLGMLVEGDERNG